MRPGDLPPPEGWRAFLKKVASEAFNPGLGSAMFAELRSHHEAIKKALKHTMVVTSGQRLRENPGFKVSYRRFYRFVRTHLPEVFERISIMVRREGPPPRE